MKRKNINSIIKDTAIELQRIANERKTRIENLEKCLHNVVATLDENSSMRKDILELLNS